MWGDAAGPIGAILAAALAVGFYGALMAGLFILAAGG
jgi:hypothetical protein